MSGPLAGLRILEVGHILAGPFATMLLADLGADVIKVESKTGDLSREVGSQYVDGHNVYFASINRNKRSVRIDLDTEDGQADLHRLVETSDALLVNLRPPATQTSSDATFTFDATDDDGGSGVDTALCRFDGGAWTPCTSPAVYPNLPGPRPARHRGEADLRQMALEPAIQSHPIIVGRDRELPNGVRWLAPGHPAIRTATRPRYMAHRPASSETAT